jgi:hypothetical protein
MMHYHALSATRAALNYYLSPEGLSAWLELFSYTAHDAASLTRLHTELSAQPPQLRAYALAGNAEPPLVIAQLSDYRVMERPLGHTAGGLEATISEQSVKIEVIAKGADEAEALAFTVYSALKQARADFLANGYLSYKVENITELAPHEALAAEELGMYIRRLDMSAQIQDAIARLGAWDTEHGPLNAQLRRHGGAIDPA